MLAVYIKQFLTRLSGLSDQKTIHTLHMAITATSAGASKFQATAQLSWIENLNFSMYLLELFVNWSVWLKNAEVAWQFKRQKFRMGSLSLSLIKALFLKILTKKCQKKSIFAKKSLFWHFFVNFFKKRRPYS